MIKLSNKLEISPAIFVLFLIFTLIDGVFYVLIIYLCAALHEGAHIFAAKLSGCEIERLRVLAIGADIKLKNTNTISYKKEFFIAISGPLINLCLVIIMICIQLIFGISPLFQLFTFCNAILFFINILPIMPLDGGRALYSLLLLKVNIVKAANISDFVSLFTVIPILASGLYILYITGYNFSLLVISIYLLVIFVIKNISSKA